MFPPIDDEAEDASEEGLAVEELGDVSLDELETLEEEEVTGHRVTTFEPSNEGESYFDGAYFDE